VIRAAIRPCRSEHAIPQEDEALFPQFKPLELLLERKHEMSIGSWEAEYQQNLMVIGGGLIEHVAGECSIPTC
jgi:hypothetical protein